MAENATVARVASEGNRSKSASINEHPANGAEIVAIKTSQYRLDNIYSVSEVSGKLQTCFFISFILINQSVLQLC